MIIQRVSRQFKASPVHHQCISTLFKLSRLMTHHHQKKFQNDTQWFNQISNYDGSWLITTNSSRCQNNYSSILFTIDTVRDSSSQISQRILFNKDNNSRTVQGPLLCSTIPLLTWLQSKFNTKQQQFKIVGDNYQHKIQSLPSTCILLIRSCIL